MPIRLSSILPIRNLKDYKAHLACWNGYSHPLDDFVRDRTEWDQWSEYRGKKDRFNRRYIFSLIEFYPEGPGNWLFGGTYKVLDRLPDSYKLERISDHEDYVGRVKICLSRPGRVDAVRLENHYSNMIVTEVLREPYSGERFPGYERINHDFSALEVVFRAQRPDWKAALENVKGVYLIADKRNGKKYVGSAYGDLGIWARWGSYIGTGHGGNDELTKLIKHKGIDYARQNFRISLLEFRSPKTDDRVVIERETYWKEALLSRRPLGYNKN